MTSIQNLASVDPFADDSNTGDSSGNNYIHIRIFQRTGRKAVTTIENLPKNFNFEKVLKHFKKSFSCNGNIATDDQIGKVIQLQGDHRKEVQNFLIEEKISKPAYVKIHGF
ncbi:hypothetical protein CYY_010402 [Polysphondylium violaceum]|uniref:SUI1 domain-containing protein n=1 Tax=Polysphondylium violaceum TaxID=133409 RepID=A0A8J4PJW3_9MYCE|nr:hypothetical protein CYY_010402 [Polysphondylium violaceum]